MTPRLARFGVTSDGVIVDDTSNPELSHVRPAPARPASAPAPRRGHQRRHLTIRTSTPSPRSLEIGPKPAGRRAPQRRPPSRPDSSLHGEHDRLGTAQRSMRDEDRDATIELAALRRGVRCHRVGFASGLGAKAHCWILELPAYRGYDCAGALEGKGTVGGGVAELVGIANHRHATSVAGSDLF